jgi:adenylate kinase family enzyme
MGEILDLPVHHLDPLHWKPDWVARPKEEWQKIQVDLCAEEEWIIDGNYGGTMDIRMEACDTVVFLDMSRWLCAFRALKRTYIEGNKPQADRPEAVRRKWIWNSCDGYGIIRQKGVRESCSDLMKWRRTNV